MKIAKQCVCCNSVHLKKSPAILMPFLAHRIFGWEPVHVDKTWQMRTIEPGVNYAICNSLLCTQCYHLFLDMRFNDEEMSLLYSGYREKEYTALREKYEPGYKERNILLDTTRKYIPQIESFLFHLLKLPINILDYGGDTGQNTPFQKSHKLFDIYDISSKALVEGARKVDLKTAQTNDYDLIVCSNVLEHIPYPRHMITEIRSLMHKKTILYIEVPYEKIIRDFSQAEDLLYNKRHWHEHINFFNRNSLEMMLAQHNLKVLSYHELSNNDGTNLFQVACSL